MSATLTQYTYSYRDQAGKVRRGKAEAESDHIVRDRLRAEGVIALEVNVANAGMQREISLGLPKRIKPQDLAIFARQFATMLNAGLTMMRCLTILAQQSENEELRKVLRAVRNDIEAGHPLSVAMSKHPSAFPELMLNMTRAGEAGGFLDQTMQQIAGALEADVKLRGKIKSAMTYPVVVFVMAILMCTAMLIFIVPTFENMFTNLGGELPLPTQILVNLSDLLRATWWGVLAAAIALNVLWRKHRHTEQVRNVFDPLKLRLPVFGGLTQKIAMARFARNLGTLLASGVPILRSLDIVSDTTGSIVISRALKEVKESVTTGESITGPLSEHDVFPPMVAQMMVVGEDTGALDQMLHKIAEFYDQQVEATTEALTSLIEPLMIAFLGVVVGSMIVALYMPIFKIFDLIG